MLSRGVKQVEDAYGAPRSKRPSAAVRANTEIQGRARECRDPKRGVTAPGPGSVDHPTAGWVMAQGSVAGRRRPGAQSPSSAEMLFLVAREVADLGRSSRAERSGARPRPQSSVPRPSSADQGPLGGPVPGGASRVGMPAPGPINVVRRAKVGPMHLAHTSRC